MKIVRDELISEDDEKVEKLIINKKLKSLPSKNAELNIFLFKDIAVYLVLFLNSKNDKELEPIENESFRKILELSLLSKSCFKIIQNIICSFSFYKNSNKFILTFENFLKYIKMESKTKTTKSITTITTMATAMTTTNNNYNNNYYKFKLVQYKEIESIKFELIKYGKEFKFEKSNYLNNVKLELIKNCENLKKVVIEKSNHNNSVDSNCKQDYTCNGFYKFKKLSLLWSEKKGFPISILGGEKLESINLDEEDDDDGDNENIDYNDDEDRGEDHYKKFSFKFLNKYKPTNLKISTSNDRDNFYQLNEINNILINCNSIKRINFKHHHTPSNFFNFAISKNEKQKVEVPPTSYIKHSNKLKLLKVRLGSMSDDDFYNLNNNSELKELIFKYPITIKRFNSNTFKNLDSLIYSLSNLSNINIETLGLESFEFEDYKLLSSLSKLKNISTLICSRYNLEPILQHLNENENIKHLILKDQKEMVGQDDDNDEIRQLLSSFFNNNKSSLKLITIKIKNDDDDDEQQEEGDNEIITQYQNSPSFKTLNLKFKKFK